LPSTQDCLQRTLGILEELLAVAEGQHIQRVREEALRHAVLAVRLLAGAALRILNDLPGVWSTFLRVGQVFGPSPARVESQVPAELL
jgi:hypothetical protein